MKVKQLSLFTNNVNAMTQSELEKTIQNLYKNCIKYTKNYKGYKDITDDIIYLTEEQLKNIDFIISVYVQLYNKYRWCNFYRFEHVDDTNIFKVYIDKDTD